VFFGSTSILQGVPLVNNTNYPGIADDLAASYKKLKSLPCDVFFAPHGSFFGLENKTERLERGEKPNPFVDATAFKKFVEQAERKFVNQLEQERKAVSEIKKLGN
jgi:metallo-beta-lactamase class B